jgi:hypothetical protein
LSWSRRSQISRVRPVQGLCLLGQRLKGVPALLGRGAEGGIEIGTRVPGRPAERVLFGIAGLPQLLVEVAAIPFQAFGHR